MDIYTTIHGRTFFFPLFLRKNNRKKDEYEDLENTM